MESHSFKYKERHKLEELLSADIKQKPFARLSCPGCQEKVVVEDLDLATMIGKCRACDAVFPIDSEINSLKQASELKRPLAKPANVDVFYFQDEMEISIAQPAGLLDYLLLSLVFVVIFITMIYLKGNVSTAFLVGSWIANLFPLYYFFRRFLATLHIKMDRNNLSVICRPKNGNKDKSWPIEQIDQIYIKDTETGRSIMMILNSPEGERHVKLISNVSNLSKAHYLEQEIEKYLDISNRHVLGESKAGRNNDEKPI